MSDPADLYKCPECGYEDHRSEFDGIVGLSCPECGAEIIEEEEQDE